MSTASANWLVWGVETSAPADRNQQSFATRFMWNRRKMCAVGQNFQPDVRLESLTYTCAIRTAGTLTILCRFGVVDNVLRVPGMGEQDGQPIIAR